MTRSEEGLFGLLNVKTLCDGKRWRNGNGIVEN